MQILYLSTGMVRSKIRAIWDQTIPSVDGHPYDTGFGTGTVMSRQQGFRAENPWMWLIDENGHGTMLAAMLRNEVPRGFSGAATVQSYYC